MGASTTEIKSITGTTVSDDCLNTFIVLADQMSARIAVCNPSLTSAELDSFANWYASYLLAGSGQGKALDVTKRKIEQFEVTYSGNSGSNASSSQRYWNTANEISGGCLKAITEEKSQVLVL